MTDRLSPGDTAPDFTLTSDTGDEVSLGDLRGQKVIVYFYPAAMTPGCTTQANDFSSALDELAAAEVAVLGVSPDKPDKLRKFADNEGLTFPLLSDFDKGLMETYGAFGEKKLYGKLTVGVIRSTFVIDPEGKIEKSYYNVKATGHVARIRKDLGI